MHFLDIRCWSDLTEICFWESDLYNESAWQGNEYAKNHYLNQCWPSSLIPIYMSVSQWVNTNVPWHRQWSFHPTLSLRWRHNGRKCVSNHQHLDCLLNRLFRRRWKETSKLRVTGLCAGNSPGTGQFPAQIASNAGNVSIWWRHHVICFQDDTHFIHTVYLAHRQTS